MGWFQPRLSVRLVAAMGAWWKWRRLLSDHPDVKKLWRSIRWRWRTRAIHTGLMKDGSFTLVRRREDGGSESRRFWSHDLPPSDWEPNSPEWKSFLEEEFPAVERLCIFSIARQEYFPKGDRRYRGPVFEIHVCMDTGRLLKLSEGQWVS